MRAFSDVPYRFNQGQTLCCDGRSYTIATSSRRRGNQIVLKLDGIDHPNAAADLVGRWLTAPPESTPELPQGEYFHFQLLGLRVVTGEGEELGRVTEIIPTGSNDVYVVTGERGEVLLPAIGEVIRNVDLSRGVMVVQLLEGLR